MLAAAARNFDAMQEHFRPPEKIEVALRASYSARPVGDEEAGCDPTVRLQFPESMEVLPDSLKEDNWPFQEKMETVEHGSGKTWLPCHCQILYTGEFRD